MVKRKIDKQTKLILEKNLVLIKRNLSPELIYLFGSRARGDNLKTSDLDLLIVSSKFEGINWRDRIVLVLDIWQGNDIILEPLCLTPLEFNNRKEELSIVGQAVKEGILI